MEHDAVTGSGNIYRGDTLELSVGPTDMEIRMWAYTESPGDTVDERAANAERLIKWATDGTLPESTHF